MGLPNSLTIASMDWAYAGMPFVNVPSRANVDTSTMDWAYAGMPFVTNPPKLGPINVMTWCGVPLDNIQTINGVQLANIQTIDGVS